MTVRRDTIEVERGVVLIAVLFVLMVVSITALSLAREVRMELGVSARAADDVMARALVDSAIERARAALRLDEVAGDALRDTWREDDTAFQGVELGAGRFWVFFGEADPGDGKEHRFGLRDEASKLNLNLADEDALIALGLLDEPMVAAILDWRDSDDEPRPDGAEAEYYALLSPGYRPKNAAFESLEELLLVRGIDEAVLYGEDRNRNGLLDPGEDDGDVSFPPDDADGVLDRGLADFVTLWSAEPDVTFENRERLSTQDASPDDIRQRLIEAGLAAGIASDVADLFGGGGGGGGGGRGRPAPRPQSIGDVLILDSVDTAAMRIIGDELTMAGAGSGEDDGLTLTPGRINVNTASREVLRTIPGLDDEMLDAILARRQAEGDDLSSPAWLLDVLPREVVRLIWDDVTTRAWQFSFQAAVWLPDRGVTRRVEVVLDRTTAPPRVLWRRDLRTLGFPLPDQRGEDKP